MSKIAILIGATGLTGGILLDKLISDSYINKVKLFSRSSIGNSHPKIEEHIIDLFQLENEIEAFTGDVVFCCIGTTKAKTPNQETYRKIDFGIPVAAAKLCKKNGINTFIVISSLGADSKSNVFYNRTKGEMENEVLALGIANCSILRPSIIDGPRKEKRLGEQISKIILNILGPIIPKAYRSINPETIALAMLSLYKKGDYQTIIRSEKIKEIARE